jgi:hypothetical protein
MWRRDAFLLLARESSCGKGGVKLACGVAQLHDTEIWAWAWIEMTLWRIMSLNNGRFLEGHVLAI